MFHTTVRPKTSGPKILYNTSLKLKADRPHPLDYSTQRQTPRTDTNDSALLFAALGKAEPPISTAVHQKFDLDLDL